MAKPGVDIYKRVEIGGGVYQCGCHWEHQDDEFGKGDVLIQCTIHHQATVASVNKFERERR